MQKAISYVRQDARLVLTRVAAATVRLVEFVYKQSGPILGAHLGRWDSHSCKSQQPATSAAHQSATNVLFPRVSKPNRREKAKAQAETGRFGRTKEPSVAH